MRIAATTFAFLFAAAAHAQAPAKPPAPAPPADMGAVRQAADNTYAPVQGLPGCMLGALQNGDPGTGPSVIAFKASAGCLIPWHWHTPTEQLVLVSGTAKLEMKGGATTVLLAGGYARFPSKHVHQFTCPTACSGFIGSDAPFDIHYVDASGKELTPEAALATKK